MVFTGNNPEVKPLNLTKVAANQRRHFGTSPISDEDFSELMKPINTDKQISNVRMVRARIAR